LVAKICARLKEMIRFRKEKRKRDLETESAKCSRRKVDAVECESGNVEAQWSNIKTLVRYDTMGDLVVKVWRGEQEGHGLHRK
jgi:hypothetical protein